VILEAKKSWKEKGRGGRSGRNLPHGTFLEALYVKGKDKRQGGWSTE